MGTVIRPELSKKNRYWISRHRYYELKHFCLQYPAWKREYAVIGGVKRKPADMEELSKTNQHSDPTSQDAIELVFYSSRIEMVERVAVETDYVLSKYILKGVTEGISYTNLKARLDIPCCKDVYYELYRRFFWLLDKERQ